MPPLATWLDRAWLAISLSCLAYHFIRESRKRISSRRILRATAVLVILVVFFPYLSVSDDLVDLESIAPCAWSRTEVSSPVPFDPLPAASSELGIRLQKLANVHLTPFHPEPEAFRSVASVPVSFSAFPWRPAPRQASRAPPAP